jgi:hypothetical protein
MMREYIRAIPSTGGELHLPASGLRTAPQRDVWCHGLSGRCDEDRPSFCGIGSRRERMCCGVS